MIAMREFFGKPDQRLDQAALQKAVRETVPALAVALAGPEFEVDHVERLKITRAKTKALREWAAKNPTLKPKKRQDRKFKAPLAGRLTKLRRALLTAHVPAIGAFTQGRSRLDATQMLNRVIEMMLRLDGHKVTVSVTAIEPAVNGVPAISVVCDRPGLLEARAAEFSRLSADVKGPITNPYFVAIRRDGITVANHLVVEASRQDKRLIHRR